MIRMDYAKEFIKLERQGDIADMTVNEFFDHCEIPKEDRNDFLMACIMNNVSIIQTGEGEPFEKSKFAKQIDGALLNLWGKMASVAAKLSKRKKQ